MIAAAVAPGVLALAVPDVLDTTLAESLGEQGTNLVFLCDSEVVEGGRSTLCGDPDLSAAARQLVAEYLPTHLVVRDSSGAPEDLDRCRRFVAGALTGPGGSVTAVIQTHPLPQTAVTACYDTWLKTASPVRPTRCLSVIWHTRLSTEDADGRGDIRRVDTDLAWRHAAWPARIIRRQVRDPGAHNLEYIAGRNA